MTKNLSNKFRILSLVATIMVVYRHSLNYLAFFHSWNGEGVNGFVQDACMVFTQVAVPYFFLASGFFFLRKDYYQRETYWGMIRKKSRTLFLPFLIWNIVGLACLLVTKQQVEINSTPAFFLQLLHSDYYGPLWFVRDLMMLMLLVPIYQWMYQYNSWFIYLSVGLFLLFYWIPIDCGFLSSEGLLFFFLAGVLQKNERVLERKVPLSIFIILFVIWAGLCLFTPAFNYLHKFCTLLGVLVLWLLPDFSPILKSSTLKKISRYSFIIYVLHFYPLKVIKVTLGEMFFGNAWVSMATYLLLPLIVTLMAIGIGYLFKRYIPKLYFLSTGGR